MPSWQHSSKFILLVIDRAGPSYCTLFLLRERDKLLDTMNTEILNGRALAKTIKNDLTSHVATLKKQPQLRIVSIGEDAASKIYIQQKVKFGQAIGVKVAVDTYDSGVTTNSLLNARVNIKLICINEPLIDDAKFWIQLSKRGVYQCNRLVIGIFLLQTAIRHISFMIF